MNRAVDHIVVIIINHLSLVVSTRDPNRFADWILLGVLAWK
jgi:hypothetical protein